MRRSRVLGFVVVTLGLSSIGAPCGGGGGSPAARSFGAGSLVIPMDNCYQRRDNTAALQTVACNASADAGVFRAYGVVYFLLAHDVTVYWAIDPAKTAVTGVDLSVPAPGSGSVAKKLDWGTGGFVDFYPAATGVTYVGAPFVIDAADRDRVVSMLTNPADAAHADFARFQAEHVVEVHELMSGFNAAQVRPLIGPPPRIAILNVGGAAVSVMHDYVIDAGLDDPSCTPPSCGGGITGSGYCCGATSAPDCTSSIGFPVNTSPGRIYDILCDKDFLPSSGTDITTAKLLEKDGQGKQVYRLLWAPHWAGGADPNGTTAADKTLAQQLTAIARFVDGGSDLFAECHSIATLEGGGNVEPGFSLTRFQSTNTMRYNTTGPATLLPPAATHPNTQIGDFAFAPQGGSIKTFHPNEAVSSTYVAGVDRFITEIVNGKPWDVYTMVRKDGVQTKGNVVYMGGHTYATQTAGTRLVLNTLFNLGFGCSDPGTTCSTGKLGVCGRGVLRCAPAGYACVSAQPESPETCNGLDDDCDGEVDEGGVCTPDPVCTEGDTRSCYDGPAGTEGQGDCHAGTAACAAGAWGPCLGERLPSPEVCNGRDDDCNGTADDGALCPDQVCVSGFCVTPMCDAEINHCPEGFDCTGGVCTPAICVDNLACPSGQRCTDLAGTWTCVDPCLGISCAQGASCFLGSCVSGGCYATGCPAAGEVCLGGACVADPCAPVTCPEGTFCRGGDCVRSCAYVQCAAGETCGADGFCVPACQPACGTGEICVDGACRADPCSGITCGVGLVCAGGLCGDDPCAAVTCPVGTCSAGQCVAASDAPATTAEPAKSGCGCASGSGADLLALFLAAAAIAPRVRRRARPLRLPLALVLAALLGASGCSKEESCAAGLTACGDACSDLARSTADCGACGHACSAGWQCVAGGCVFDTGNPYLASMIPTAAAPGTLVPISFTGQGFEQGAVARFQGAGLDRVESLTVSSATAAALASPLDLSGATVGTVEVRILNPGRTVPDVGRLVSNPLQLQLSAGFALYGVSPAGARQDETRTLALTGAGFAAGLTARLGTQSVPVSQTSATAATVGPVALSAWDVGTYDLVLTSSMGPESSVKFRVNEGVPVLSSVSPDSGSATNATFTATLTGSCFYESSVVYVSGGNGAVVDSPLQTSYVGPTQLQAIANLTLVPQGAYQVTVVNPGAPAPLVSGSRTFTVGP